MQQFSGDVALRLFAGRGEEQLVRTFPVKMPSGARYWTVLDDRLE
jgi:hypothetical protein